MNKYDFALWMRCVGPALTAWVLIAMGAIFFTLGIFHSKNSGIVSGTITSGFGVMMIILWLIIVH